MTTIHLPGRSENRAVRHSFDAVTMTVHWTTAALVASLFAVALLLEHTKASETAKTLLTVHRSLGVTVWALTACRLVWRLTGASFPPFPDSMPNAQRHAARSSEYGLYGLLLAQPLTGLAQSLYLGKPFVLFAWTAPVIVTRNFAMYQVFHDIHEWGALSLAGLIGLHASAALMHALVLKDGVFQHMLPFINRGGVGRDRKRFEPSSVLETAAFLSEREEIGN